MTSKKQATANAGVLRCTQDDKRKTGTGISRGLKPVSSAGGIGLPRLKPGPISGTTARTKPGAEARFFGGGDWIAQAKAWAYLRNNDKDKTRG